MKKTSSRGKLIKQIDALFRAIILLERPHKCEWCKRENEPGKLQISHILPKGSHPKIRHYKPNVLLLCYHCHLGLWHKDPIKAWEFIRDYKGEDFKDSLLIAERIAPKQSAFGLELFKRELEEELNMKRGEL